MSKPLWFRGKTLQHWENQAEQIKSIAKDSNLLFFAIALIIFAIIIGLWNSQTTAYAHAYVGNSAVKNKSTVPLLEKNSKLFEGKKNIYTEKADPIRQVPENENISAASFIKVDNRLGIVDLSMKESDAKRENETREFAEKLYEIVGDTPIKDMVPFISQRDNKVAAFLVGIAKKESSFGSRSPLKDGETCYNYWGYKGAGERGTGMGYACFASAEEAIQVVGDRIEVLVNKDRNTPARMVDTWKCGKSCAGDPGAPSWTSTVALYFNQIVDKNS